MPVVSGYVAGVVVRSVAAARPRDQSVPSSFSPLQAGVLHLPEAAALCPGSACSGCAASGGSPRPCRSGAVGKRAISERIGFIAWARRAPGRWQVVLAGGRAHGSSPPVRRADALGVLDRRLGVGHWWCGPACGMKELQRTSASIALGGSSGESGTRWVRKVRYPMRHILLLPCLWLAGKSRGYETAVSRWESLPPTSCGTLNFVGMSARPLSPRC